MLNVKASPGLLLVVLAAAAACGPVKSKSAQNPQEIRLGIWTEPTVFARQLQRHYNATIPGVNVSLVTTPGSLFNISALQSATSDVAFAQADVVYLAYRRGIQDEPYAHTNLRGIAVLGLNAAFVLVREDSAISSIGNFK